MDESPSLSKSSKPARRIWFIIIGVTVLVLLATTATILIQNRPKVPSQLRSLTSQASFKLYYPNQLPDGFSYKSGSAKDDGSVVFYALAKGDQNILVAEQAKPSQDPGLATLFGFTKVTTPLGDSYIGQQDNRPSGLIITGSTFVIVSGDTNIATAQISQVLQHLQPI